MSDLICYVNGQFVPLAQASMPVQDLSVLRGYGVFDFLRTYNGRPFKLAEHLQRLAHSASLIELDLPCSLAEIEQIVLDTLARNNLPEANIRVVVTGGVSSNSVTPDNGPGFAVLVTPVRVYPDEYYSQGIKVITVPASRFMPDAKTINYLAALVAQKKAYAAGGAEALYVNEQGHILEGTTTNLFVFSGDKLITPKIEILPGITRGVVLELARNLFEIVEDTIHLDDLPRLDEAFITASNKELMPIRQVDEQRIGGTAPGKNTRLLMRQFRQLTRGQG